MTLPATIAVVVHRQFTASPERVFDAWLDAEKAPKFMFATPEGTMVRAEIDARVGGRFTFTDRRGDMDVVHTGEYLELDRPKRIVFTFSVDGSPPDEVALDIAPSDRGCVVTLTHRMAAEWADYADRTRSGWAGMLDGLALVLEEPA